MKQMSITEVKANFDSSEKKYRKINEPCLVEV